MLPELKARDFGIGAAVAIVCYIGYYFLKKALGNSPKSTDLVC